MDSESFCLGRLALQILSGLVCTNVRVGVKHQQKESRYFPDHGLGIILATTQTTVGAAV